MVCAAGCGPTPLRQRPVDTGSTLAIASGAGFSCALRADGPVECWGRDDAGQLGDGGGEDRARPVIVAGIPDAVELALGERFACALRENGRVVCWGDDDTVVPVASAGALAMLGAQTHVRPVGGLANVVELVAGPHHVCARTRGGDVACWGAAPPVHADGASATGAADPDDGADDTDRAPARAWIGPRIVVALRGAAHIAVGGERVCALGPDGLASCVALAEDLATARAAPVRDSAPATSLAVTSHGACLADARPIRCHPFEGAPATAELRDVVALSAYEAHVCALGASGRVACRWPPAWVPDVTGATRIAAGADHACARLRTGAFVCWGSADHGQLGTGSIAAER